MNRSKKSSIEFKLLIAGLLAVAPISIRVLLEQYVLNETIIRDSNPLSFIILLIGWFGVGTIGASIGGYSITVLAKIFGVRSTQTVKKPLMILGFITSLLCTVLWWGKGMH